MSRSCCEQGEILLEFYRLRVNRFLALLKSRTFTAPGATKPSESELRAGKDGAIEALSALVAHWKACHLPHPQAELAEERCFGSPEREPLFSMQA